MRQITKSLPLQIAISFALFLSVTETGLSQGCPGGCFGYPSAGSARSQPQFSYRSASPVFQPSPSWTVANPVQPSFTNTLGMAVLGQPIIQQPQGIYPAFPSPAVASPIYPTASIFPYPTNSFPEPNLVPSNDSQFTDSTQQVQYPPAFLADPSTSIAQGNVIDGTPQLVESYTPEIPSRQTPSGVTPEDRSSADNTDEQVTGEIIVSGEENPTNLHEADSNNVDSVDIESADVVRPQLSSPSDQPIDPIDAAASNPLRTSEEKSAAAELDDSKAKLADAVNRLRALQERAKSSERAAQSLKELIAETESKNQSEIEDLQTELSKLQKELKDRDEDKVRLEKIEAKLTQEKAASKKLASQIKSANDTVRKSRLKQKSLEKEVAKYEQELAELAKRQKRAPDQKKKSVEEKSKSDVKPNDNKSEDEAKKTADPRIKKLIASRERQIKKAKQAHQRDLSKTLRQLREKDTDDVDKKIKAAKKKAEKTLDDRIEAIKKRVQTRIDRLSEK